MARITKKCYERGIRVSISGQGYSELSQFDSGTITPAAVGGRARRARVEDPADGNVDAVKRGPGSALGESADAYDHLRSQMLDGTPQGSVADLEQRPSFIRRQLVGGAVATALLEEGQWTVIGDEEAFEEQFGGAKDVSCPTPQPGAADLGAFAGETHDLPFRVLVLGPPNLGINAEPIADRPHLAKWHSGLGHPPRPWVHPQEQYFLWSIAVELEVLGVGLPRVVERVVDVRHRWCEPEATHFFAKLPGDLDEY